jgi:hypothetical protein
LCGTELYNFGGANCAELDFIGLGANCLELDSRVLVGANCFELDSIIFGNKLCKTGL